MLEDDGLLVGQNVVELVTTIVTKVPEEVEGSTLLLVEVETEVLDEAVLWLLVGVQ